MSRCFDHDDCRANHEMGRLCAQNTEMRRHATDCPRCGLLSPCDDWQEIDLGVGLQRWDLGWCCPKCGRFGYDSDHRVFDYDGI